MTIKSGVTAIIPKRALKYLRSGCWSFHKIRKRGMGTLPDFILVGPQSSGTTSLYNYLTKHPDIFSARTKEPGFFGRHYWRGFSWYRDNFLAIPKRPNKNLLTGEASTEYIINPHALRRIRTTLPNVKILVLLRNPVDRAYSHYNHTLRLGFENLTFEQALREEDFRIGESVRRMLKDETFRDELEEKGMNPSHMRIARYSYKYTGLYIKHLKVLMDIFPRKQIFILNSEDVFRNPEAAYNDVLKFLDVSRDFKFVESRIFNQGHYQPMNARTREELAEFFKPYNQRLYQYLSTDFGWEMQ